MTFMFILLGQNEAAPMPFSSDLEGNKAIMKQGRLKHEHHHEWIKLLKRTVKEVEKAKIVDKEYFFQAFILKEVT